jgi:hypothetical protein
MDPLKCQTSTATPAEPGGLLATLGRDFDAQGHLEIAMLKEFEVPRDADLFKCMCGRRPS